MLLSLLLSSFLTIVELNCENLFDCTPDSLQRDAEFQPDAPRHWTPARYWQKLNRVGQEILSCADEMPDLVALCEVESDTVMYDLTHRSLLRNAGYRYVMTESADVRGLDVALLYQPARFRPICYDDIAVSPLKGMRPTRNILYVQGECVWGDTLHVFVLHAPSRYGGEMETRPHRMHVAQTLLQAIGELPDSARIVVTGDFNDYDGSPSLQRLANGGLVNVTRQARGIHTARGTYRYRGQWQSLDHLLVSPVLKNAVDTAYINDAPFLLESDEQHGGLKPWRTYQGYRYHGGFSDHLPLVVRLRLR